MKKPDPSTLPGRWVKAPSHRRWKRTTNRLAATRVPGQAWEIGRADVQLEGEPASLDRKRKCSHRQKNPDRTVRCIQDYASSVLIANPSPLGKTSLSRGLCWLFIPLSSVVGMGLQQGGAWGNSASSPRLQVPTLVHREACPAICQREQQKHQRGQPNREKCTGHPSVEWQQRSVIAPGW